MGWLFASLRPYERTWLRGDLIAGLTVWAVLVPEALAYASIAGVSSALLAGVLRLGCLASFISEPVLKGFIVGLALDDPMGLDAPPRLEAVRGWELRAGSHSRLILES